MPTVISLCDHKARSVRDREKWEGETYLLNTSPRCFAKCWKRFFVHNSWLTLYHKRRWWDEFSTLFRIGANGRKRFDLGLLPSGELSSNICSFPPSGSSAKNPRISSKVELNEAFKSLSVITRLLRSVLFLVASSSRCEWTKKFKILHKSEKKYDCYIF